MTKIDIFSGFLGAGKTTLIKKLLKEAYSFEKVVLIENEFGEIGIDGSFLKEAGVQITEMNSGCICCSLVGDFSKALEKVLEEFHPERIIIEPSGVGKLSDVIKAIKSIHSDEISLNAFTAVVDVNKCKMYMKNFGEFFNDQIKNANTLILSHTENASEEKIEACVHSLREHNSKATIITTPWDSLEGKAILSAMEEGKSLIEELQKLKSEIHDHEAHHRHHDDDEDCDCHKHHHHHHDDDEDCDCHKHHHHHHDDDEDCECHEHHHHHDDDEDCDCHKHHHHHHDDDEDCDCHKHHHHHHDDDEDCECHEHHHHHHADEVFTSWGAETAKKFTAEQISNILNKFSESDEYGMVLRSKGVLASQDGEWIYFDYVPGEPDVRKGAPDVIGRICVIGSKLDEHKIEELFNI